MRKRPVIAIDGPAGSGKTTLAQALAERLALLYYDTGALYRAVTLAALERGLDPSDERAMADLARSSRIELAPPDVADGRLYTVYLDGRDVTWPIRGSEVDTSVALVAAHPAVRQALLTVQRAAARRGGVVMAGRDIGTVVAPRATLKMYLSASAAVRAERRWRQFRGQGEDVELGDVLSELLRRDAHDAGRATAPLRLAEDAVVLETDNLTVEEMVQQAVALLRRGAGPAVERAIKTVSLPHTTLHLTTGEYDLFAALVRAQGQVRSYDDLAAEVWGRDAADGKRMVQRIGASLRRKLVASGPNVPCLEHVRGRGYRLRLAPGPAQE